MSAIDPAEFQKLQTEVAELQKTLTRLQHFITMCAEPGDGPGSLSIRCQALQVESFPGNERRGSILLTVDGSTSGPAVILSRNLTGSAPRSESEENSISLSFDQNKRGKITIEDNDGAARVQLSVSDEDHGQVAVLSPGDIPRALMKALPKGGSVAALAPDGSPRAVIHSLGGNGGGEVAILSAEKKVIGKISAAELGGMISAHDSEGKPKAVLVANSGASGTILLNQPNGNTGILLSAGADLNILRLNGSDRDIIDEPHSGVTLFGMKGGGSIGIEDGEGHELIQLITGKEGGHLSVFATDAGCGVKLHAATDGGVVNVSRTGNEGAVVLKAADTGGQILTRSSKNDQHVAVQFNEHGPDILFINSENSHVAMRLGCGEGGRAVLSLQNQENTPAATLFCHENGGSIFVAGNDGVTQAGFVAGEEGGRMSVFSELGVERATLLSKFDGGNICLKWGGTNGVFAGATERGGVILVSDDEGKHIASLPAGEWGGDDFSGDPDP